jgi:hypothetical protein
MLAISDMMDERSLPVAVDRRDDRLSRSLAALLVMEPMWDSAEDRAELMEERREERAGVGRGVVVGVGVICWACAAGGCLLGREGGWKPRRWWCVTYRSQGREGGEDGGVMHFGGCDVS